MGAFLPKGFEWVIILIVVLVIFGPKNIPRLGAALSKSIKNLRAGLGKKKEDKKEAAASAAEAAAETPAAEPAAVAPLVAEPEVAVEAEVVEEPAAQDVSAAVQQEAAFEETPAAAKTVKRVVVRKKVQE